MYDFKIVKNYAGALYNNSESVEEAASILNDLMLILEVCSKFPELNKLLSSPIIDIDKKYKIFKSIAGKLDLSKKVEKFIFIILNNARFFTLPDIVKYFTKLYYNAAGMKMVGVVSAKPLSDSEMQLIREHLESKLEKKIVINSKIDSSLLGGAVIKYDSILVDCSIKGVINSIRQSLSDIKI